MGPGINPKRVRVTNSQQGQRRGIDSCLLIQFSGSAVTLAPLKIEQNCLVSPLVQTGGRSLTRCMAIQRLEHEMSSCLEHPVRPVSSKMSEAAYENIPA